ncbi:MAG: UDP-N-acetylglucosamine 1-carboxyvinyltransferase [Caldilineaceae bacterium]|nr:UDP-N-acetylglucosamine 1-carboxyvinyltransferase [Caldilineaceae bacterium]HRJ42950.1 UDP-N-acetylglucosamine 1-carboxyvinyltransferase [Caldilineaceae bacterium]
MSSYVIHGGSPIQGTITPSGNKNAAMPMAEACLLTDEPVILHNMPQIGDVETVLEILAGLGVDVQRTGTTVTLCAANLRGTEPDPRLFAQIRGSLTLMGPLLTRHGHFAVPATAGGDDIGRRRIDTHLHIFGQLGVEMVHKGRFEMKTNGRLTGQDILLDEASVTATENGLMAASLAQGKTILRNAASEPHVQDLCHLLVRMGCPIEGIGSNTLTIHGQERLHGAEYTVGPDFMEIGSYIGLGAITPGELRISGIVPEHLRMMEMVFVDRLGVRMRREEDRASATGWSLVVADAQELRVRTDFGGAIPRIDDQPWPAFPPDLMSIALVVATQAKGTVLIHEKMYDGRLYFVDKLVSMGAQVILCDPHRAVVVGPSQLTGQQITSPDIRAGMALILAALAAQGTTVIGNIQQIDRGYQRIDEKLRAIGAKIERVD